MTEDKDTGRPTSQYLNNNAKHFDNRTVTDDY